MHESIVIKRNGKTIHNITNFHPGFKTVKSMNLVKQTAFTSEGFTIRRNRKKPLLPRVVIKLVFPFPPPSLSHFSSPQNKADPTLRVHGENPQKQKQGQLDDASWIASCPFIGDSSPLAYFLMRILPYLDREKRECPRGCIKLTGGGREGIPFFENFNYTLDFTSPLENVTRLYSTFESFFENHLLFRYFLPKR